MENHYDTKLQKTNTGVSLGDLRGTNNQILPSHNTQPTVFAHSQQSNQQDPQQQIHPQNTASQQNAQQKPPQQQSFQQYTIPPQFGLPSQSHFNPPTFTNSNQSFNPQHTPNFQSMNSSIFNHPDFQMLLRHYNQDEGDKSAGQCELSEADLAYRFPTLVSHNYFKENPSYVYLKMSTLAKEEMTRSNSVYKAPKSPLEKLDQNAKKVLIETTYEAEVDNLNDKLHKARFARGVITPATRLFQMSAERIDSQQVLFFIK